MGIYVRETLKTSKEKNSCFNTEGKKVFQAFIKGNTKTKGQAATKRKHRITKLSFPRHIDLTTFCLCMVSIKLGNTHFKILPRM